MDSFRVVCNFREVDKELEGRERRFRVASARTLTAVAKAANEGQKVELGRKFVLRNQYTIKSLRYYKASESRPIARQDSVVGTMSPYLPLQESGGVDKAKGKAIPMPTLKGRGGSKARAIPKRLQLKTLGPKAFVLAPSSGSVRKRHGKVVPHTLERAALFYRPSTRRLVKLRLVDQETQRVRPTHWHTEAVRRYGSHAAIMAAYIREARALRLGE